MFAEIVGFTSFIQNDEALAMINLQRHNLFLGSLFPQFHGKEIRTIGDAFLVEFENVLNAVQCAIEIQTKLRKQNEGLFVSDEDKIRIQIGIHLGDIIHRERDVFGDAVNIASLIQTLAELEGICVSEQVFHQVRNKISVEF